jgi:putative ABC transport system substrate-binding protein
VKRREFITLLGGAVAWPFEGLAQSPCHRPIIGFLGAGSKLSGGRYYGGFPQGMRELGFLEGRDYIFEDRYADGDPTRLPLLAEDLVRLKPDVIVTSNSAATLVVKRATVTIPIVSTNLTEPVEFGLAASEARPAANVTGILSRVEGLAGKQLELAHDVMPAATKIGVLLNPNNPSNVVQWRQTEPVAAKMGLSLIPIELRTADEVGFAFHSFGREGANIIVVFADAMFLSLRRQIAAFALVRQLPTIYAWREHVDDGGLISYGTELRERFHRAASYVNRILKGARLRGGGRSYR